MRLVNVETVYAELLKGDYIILAGAVHQFLQTGFQALFGSLQRLDCKAFRTARFEFFKTFFDFRNLLLQKSLLSFLRYGDSLKLAVSNDDCIVVAGCNSAAELLTVSWFKVFFGCGENIGRRIQTEKFTCPLFGQVVRNDKQRLLAQAESLAFHRRGYHFKSLARTNLVCKERIASVEDVCNGVLLMLTELDFGVHTAEHDMAAVVLTRTGRIEKLIVLGDKLLSPVGVSPNPIPERIFDRLLLLLCKGRFLGVEHTALTPIGIGYGVIDTHITQIQSVLQNLICVGSLCSIGHIGVYIAVGRLRLACNVPLCRERRIVDFDGSPQIIRRLKGLHHKLLNIGLVNPRCTQANLNLRSIKVFGLCRFKSFHIIEDEVVFFRTLGVLQGFLIVGELFTDVTGKEIVCRSPSIGAVWLSVEIHIDNATQIACEFFFGFAGELRHIRHINLGFFCDGNCQSFRSGVNGCYDLARLDRAFGEHIRFAFEIVVLVENFQGAKQIVGAVIGKGESVATAVDKTVLCGEIVVEFVQLSLGLSDRLVGDISVHLLTD